MSDLSFDKPTRERLVLQGESMAPGHIPINGPPQLLFSCSRSMTDKMLYLEIKKTKKEQQQRGMVKITHSCDSNQMCYHVVYVVLVTILPKEASQQKPV